MSDILGSVAQRYEHTRGRVYPEPEHPYRTPYQRDRERIIHSTAFRRLEYKTQVFVNHEGDHYRTRLTHTLEVAQIARSLARALRLSEDLTEAIALAHDLGHTPFGHAGEETLDELMQRHGDRFEHNRHGLRVVDVLEERYPAFRGLNLTYEVREAFARHSTCYDLPRQPPEGFSADEMPTLEAQLVAIADEIAYDAHDVDDGLYSGILSEEEVRRLGIFKAVAERLVVSGTHLDAIASPEVRRKQLVRGLIDLFASAVFEETGRLIKVAGVRTVDDVRRWGRPLAALPGPLADIKKELEAFLSEHLYHHHRVRVVTDNCKALLRRLFDAYLAEPVLMPPEHHTRTLATPPYQVVCDYIAGMTDRYAQQEYERLRCPAERLGSLPKGAGDER